MSVGHGPCRSDATAAIPHARRRAGAGVADASRFEREIVEMVPRCEKVRLKANRRVVLSWACDDRTLHVHACFVHAPHAVRQALARAATEMRRGARHSPAYKTLHAWLDGPGRAKFAEAVKRKKARKPAGRPRRKRSRRPRTCQGTEGQQAFLRDAFQHFNRSRFADSLPDMPLWIRTRMRRTLGDCRVETRDGGRRGVRGISIQADLFLPGNEHLLAQTLIHEMAHAKAWLDHGDRGHGPAWEAAAMRAGCLPRRLYDGDPVRRPRGAPATTRVPDIPLADYP